MGTSRVYLRLRAAILLLYLTLAAISLNHCDAERSMHILKVHKHGSSISKKLKNLKMIKHFDLDPYLDSSNIQPYSVSSPYSLPPYESLAPIPLPENSPPYCVYPPNPPSTTIPTPTGYPLSPPPPYSYSSPFLPTQNPPPSPTGSLPTPTPQVVPSPPSGLPGSPEPVLNPPVIFPGPPYFELSPPFNIPSPSTIPSPTGGGSVPSPTVFKPPVVYPPPSVPPPPLNAAPSSGLWCVAKPTVPDPIIQEAMSYACGSGADCDSIQPNGPCFEPNSVYAHASYAFNSFWQRSKVNGGTCEFGGTAMLVAVDPSYDGCHFAYD